MNNIVRIGVTGTGGLGTHLARDIDSTEGAEVYAVTDVSDENRATAGETFGVPNERRYTNHETMLDTESIDAVIIATPHSLHYEQTVAALERGIDTLCEKPLCTNLENARDLVVRSEESDTVLMVGYQRHLDPAFKRARETLSDRIGEPKFITAEITQNWISNQRGAWRTNSDLSGGGQLYDTGSHLLDVVLWMTGLDPVAVNARMWFDDEEERVDKQAAINITFENGAVASIGVSGDSPHVREHHHIWGDDGAIYIDGENWDERELEYSDDENNRFVPKLDRWNSGNKAEVFVDLV